jgi:hypothetical protein
MKKLILLAALLIPTLAIADPYYHNGWHGTHNPYHGWRERGNRGFGWGGFFGGIILGGIIVHEIDGQYYDENNIEVRRVLVCNDIPMYDQYGYIVRYEHRCHYEWIQVN